MIFRRIVLFALSLSPLLAFGATFTAAHAQCAAGTLCDPLNPSFSSIPKFVAGALRAMVIIALPIISFFVVFAGFKFISAQGNESKLSEAKQNFVYVVIGAILMLGAWVIASLISGTVSQLVA